MYIRANEPRMRVPEKLKRDFDWTKVILLMHLVILSMLSLFFISQVYIRTLLFAWLLIMFGVLGVTAGAHRLWAHKSYAATTSLKIFLMLCQTLVGQGTIYNWVLQHRIHHKYEGTNFDPFNKNRGFLYSHILHFVEKSHEFQDQLEAEIDMSDLQNDKVVMFQKKYYWILAFVLFALLPMNAPAEYWGENLIASCLIVGWLRYLIVLNISWCLHSAIHVWGIKNKKNSSNPEDTNLIFFVKQTHWIKYHYMVPWDYLCGEFGKYGTDCTTKFIKICAVLGCASELKTIDGDTLREVAQNAIAEKKPLFDSLQDAEKICVEKELYLKPMKVLM